MNHILTSYQQVEEHPTLQSEVFPSVHEYGGVYIKDKTFPGMNDKQIKSLFPNVIIPDDIDLSQGWWKSERKETEEEFKVRVKSVFIKLKEMAVKVEDDYAVCLVSHGLFLNALFSLMANVDYLTESNRRMI